MRQGYRKQSRGFKDVVSWVLWLVHSLPVKACSAPMDITLQQVLPSSAIAFIHTKALPAFSFTCYSVFRWESGGTEYWSLLPFTHDPMYKEHMYERGFNVYVSEHEHHITHEPHCFPSPLPAMRKINMLKLILAFVHHLSFPAALLSSFFSLFLVL